MLTAWEGNESHHSNNRANNVLVFFSFRGVFHESCIVLFYLCPLEDYGLSPRTFVFQSIASAALQNGHFLYINVQRLFVTRTHSDVISKADVLKYFVK